MSESEQTTTTTVQQPQPSSHFVKKVYTLPIVNGALDYAKTVYDGTKGRYQVVGQVEGLVGGIYPHVVKATPAIVTKGLTQLDSLACTSLDLLETRVPILKEPPSAIVAAVDQLIASALIYSEHQMDNILPQIQQEPTDAAEPGTTTPTSNGEEVDLKKATQSNIVRAQKLGAELTHRLSKKAHQFTSQKLLTVETIQLTSSVVEKQLANLKASFETALTTLHGEEKNLLKRLDALTTELRASFASAIEKVEKMTPATVLETTSVILDNLSKSLSNFTHKAEETLNQIQQSTKDPLFKKLLESTTLTLHYIQDYSRHLQALTTIKKPKEVEVEQPSEELEQTPSSS